MANQASPKTRTDEEDAGDFVEVTDDSTDSSPPLHPVRHRQQELFLCQVEDAALKDLNPILEHPFFALSKKPDVEERTYWSPCGNYWVKITPSSKGMATIYDKDVLIYAISQLVAAMNRGEEINPTIRITARDMLVFCNRSTGGREYESILSSVVRLRSTTISTNLKTGDVEDTRVFGLVEQGTIRKKNGPDGRLLWIELTLSDWLMRAVRSSEVLTLSPEYFRLKKPLERRIYELARKHCGRQSEWRINMDTLHKKSGSRSRPRQFRYLVLQIVATNHLPDYHIEHLVKEGRRGKVDQIRFRPKQALPQTAEAPNELPALQTSTFTSAKRILGREVDVYAVESEWRHWWDRKGRPPCANPDGAFIGFCKQKAAVDPEF